MTSSAVTASIAPPPARYPDGRFGPGNPGRRPGSRNRATHRVVMGLLEHFEAHQGAVLDRLAAHNTAVYVGVLTRLLPRLLPHEGEAGPVAIDDLSDAEVAVTLSGVLAAFRDNSDNPRRALIELEAALAGEKAAEPAAG